MLTSILLAYLLSVSIDVEEGEKEIKLTLITSLFYALLIGIIITIIYLIFIPERPLFKAILTGSVFLICFLVSYSVSYFIKTSFTRQR